MKYKVLNSFILGIIALNFLLFWGKPSFFWIALMIVLFYSIVFISGIFNLSSNFFIPAYCNGDPNKIYLSYDDGPDEKRTPQLLELLEKEGIRAGFFVIGEKAKSQPELIKTMREKGHLIANHSYTHHRFFQFLSREKVMEELIKTEAIITHPQTDQRKFFRPPVGIMNPKMSRACKILKFNVIGWNLRTLDTRYSDIELLWKRTKLKLNQGKTVVLMHDNRSISLELTKRIIEYAKEKGMIFERIDEIINYK